jgi:hypothetical protein
MFSTFAFCCMMHIIFETLLCEKNHLCLNLPIKPHLAPKPTKGGIDLCQSDQVYLCPFLIKIFSSLVINPLQKPLIPLVILKPEVCFHPKILPLFSFLLFQNNLR